MTRFFFACLLTVLLVTPTLAGETYPPSASLEDVAACLAAASNEHPRLFLTGEGFAELRKECQAGGLRAELAEVIVYEADLLLEARPIERVLEGRRLLDKSRTCVKRVLTLGMAYHLTGEKKYAERAEKEMLAAARFSDWNPSHYLDVGEMTCALGVGYDWLYHELSAESRKIIRRAIVEKGLLLPFTTRHKGWVRSQNNWGQVCHGGMTVGALAVMEDEPELAAKTVHNAISNVTRSMAAYAPQGCYPEGPGYWSYGTTYNVILLDALDSVLETDFGLSLAPGFDKTGEYVSLVCGPSGQFFNYSDGGASRGLQPALYWFAARYDRPDWVADERVLLKESLPKLLRTRSASSGNRALPLALVWMDEEASTATNQGMPLCWHSENETPIVVMRNRWNDANATFVGIKGGSPSDNHGQMDIGSFVLDAGGVRWALDLGSEGYHGIESRGMNLWDRKQTSDRWTIFRQMNHGHNTLVIDDQLQRAAARAEFVAFAPGLPNEEGSASLDMSQVYEGQADRVVRSVRLRPGGEVVVEDALVGLEPGSRVRWGMITPAKAGKPGGKVIQLRQDRATLTLRIDATGTNGDAGWQVLDSATPRSEWDSPNRGTSMIAFEVVAPKSGKLNLAVVATPGQ